MPGIEGQWILGDEFNDDLDLRRELSVSLTVVDLDLVAAPYSVVVSLGCANVGGGTSRSEPLRVTEVTIQGGECPGDVNDHEYRVASVVLEALPSAFVASDGRLVLQTAQGELAFVSSGR